MIQRHSSFSMGLEDFLACMKDGEPATGPQDKDPAAELVDAIAEAILHIDWQLARLGMITVSPGAYSTYAQQKSDLALMRTRLVSMGKLAFPYSQQFRDLVQHQSHDAS